MKTVLLGTLLAALSLPAFAGTPNAAPANGHAVTKGEKVAKKTTPPRVSKKKAGKKEKNRSL